MAERFYSPNQQFLDENGNPYAGGKLHFYITGTSTETDTYSNAALSIANTNPVVLDSAGRAGNVFLDPAVTYKVILAPSTDTEPPTNPIWTADPVTAPGATADANTIDTRAAILTTDIDDGVNFIQTAGYATVGDGGGALYKRAASEPSHGGKAQSLDGTWWEMAEARANVRAFGAKADGTTDDTAAIQAAMDYFGTSSTGLDRSGGVVYFPRPFNTDGYYRCDGTLSVTNHQNLTLMGDGGRTNSFFTTPVSALVYTGTGAGVFITGVFQFHAGLRFEMLGIYHLSGFFTGTLFENHALGLQIVDCAFGQYCIQGGAVSPAYSCEAAVKLLDAHSLVIERTMFGQVKRGVYVPTGGGGESVSHVRVYKCQFYDCSFAGIHLNPGSAVQGVSIEGCYFNVIALSNGGVAGLSPEYGVYCNAVGAKITGCHFNSPHGYTGFAEAALALRNGPCVVEGNAFNVFGKAIELDTEAQAVIRGNYIGSPFGVHFVHGLAFIEGNKFAFQARLSARSTTYKLGEYIYPGSGDWMMEVTTAGTTASAAPVWPTTLDATVADGTVTWTARPLAAIHLDDSASFTGSVGINRFTSGEHFTATGSSTQGTVAWSWSMYDYQTTHNENRNIDTIIDRPFDASTNGIKTAGSFNIRNSQHSPVTLNASTSLTFQHSGREINNASAGAGAAFTYTLPVCRQGLVYEFVQYTDVRNIVVAVNGGTDVILDVGATPTSLTNTAAAGQVGARLRLRGSTVSGVGRWNVEIKTGTWS